MDHARIAELLAPFLDDAHGQRLTPDDLEHISTYIDILLRWNARINLTAIRDPAEIVPRHFGESFFAARILFPERESETSEGAPLLAAFARSGISDAGQSGGLAQEISRKITLADIGSGAGFPGIPIKLWQPAISLTLIESNQKKSTFLREVARALTLTDIDILTARAESLTAAAFETVTLRAVERFESILPTAARLVAPLGRLALLIGSTQMPLAQSILQKIAGFNVQFAQAHHIPDSRSRVLLIANRSALADLSR